MHLDDGYKCPFCGRNAFRRYGAYREDICLCSACGYQYEEPGDWWIEEILEDRFHAPEPDEKAGFPKLRNDAHNLALYGWLDKLIWHLFYRPGDLCAHEPRTGWTLLHAAAAGNQVNIVHHLVLRGADIDAVDLAGDTALHVAARWDCRDGIKALLDAGVTASLPNNAHQTPEHAAATRGHQQAVGLLRSSRVDPPDPEHGNADRRRR